MGIKERLILFIKSQNVSRSEFERNSGLSNGYINNIREGMGADKVENVLRAYPILNRTWLLTGEGTMLLSATTSPSDTMTEVYDTMIKEKDAQIEKLKAEYNQLLGENRALREMLGMKEKESSSKSA